MKQLTLATILALACVGACSDEDSGSGALGSAQGGRATEGGSSGAGMNGALAGALSGGSSGHAGSAVGGAIGAGAMTGSAGTAAGGSISGAPSAGGPAHAGGLSGGDSSGGASSAGAPAGGEANPGGGAGASSSAGAPNAPGGSTSSEGGASSAGAAGRGSSEPLPDLVISSDTSSIEFTPALYAAEFIYPGNARVVSGGIPGLFNSTRADLATNAETQSLRQSIANPSLRIIMTVTETFYRIIARRSAGITTLADLRGKTIGTISNTSAAYYIEKYLGTVGLMPDDYRVRSVFPLSQMTTLLSNGTIDAVAAWEPEPQRAANAIGDDAIIFQDRTVYREMVSLHSTAEKLADPALRPGIVEFVRSLIEASRHFRENPEEMWDYVGEELDYDPALIEQVWEDEQFAGVLAPDLLDVLVEEDVWVAREQNREPRAREQLAQLIDDSIIREAMQP